MDISAPSSTTSVVSEHGKTLHNFAVPSNVVVSNDISQSNATMDIEKSGEEVKKSLQINAEFSASYMGVSVSGSTSYAQSSDYRDDKMYAFTSQKQIIYGVAFQDWGDTLNLKANAAAMALPPWDRQNPAVLSAYYSHFQVYGTHAVMSTSYGRRYALSVNADNSSTEQQNSFSANVSAEYMGNKIDASVSSTEDYKTYTSSRQIEVDASGGDPALGALVQSNPEDRGMRDDWLKTWGNNLNEALISIGLQEIGALYSSADDAGLQKTGEQLTAAFTGLVDARRRTHCVFSSQNNAKFVVFKCNSPNAKLEGGTLQGMFFLFSTGFGQQSSGSFSLVNDGKPIDFSIGVSDPGLQKGEWINVKFINGELVKVGPGDGLDFKNIAISSVPEWVI
jgi:hypothetical protein